MDEAALEQTIANLNRSYYWRRLMRFLTAEFGEDKPDVATAARKISNALTEQVKREAQSVTDFRGRPNPYHG